MRIQKLALLAVPLALAMAFSACGGGSSSSSGNGGGGGVPTNNVLPISVSPGATGNYANGAFASVTICVPNSTNCQTIPNVLVDTGSEGLRLLASTVTIPLQNQTINGATLYNCSQFVDGFTWGAVQIADIKLAGEVGPSVPIQVIDDKQQSTVASACASTGTNENSLSALGANGILGIGEWEQDCGGYCAQQIGAQYYFTCPTTSCGEVRVPVNSQVQNPVWTFATDNNGTIINLPAATSPAQAVVNGTLIFGIGTQTNNSISGYNVYDVDNNGNFTTVFNGTSYPGSFLDTGSNGLFFPSNLPACTISTDFYCPATPQNLSATNQGTNGVSATLNFTIDNADADFSSAPSAAAFPNVGGSNTNTFDWGLPFFFGRKVFTGIENQNSPVGYGPYWAY